MNPSLSNINVGDWISPGTMCGENGNSGTTLVPHLHIVYGFTDDSGRYWALPVEWKDMQVKNIANIFTS